MYLRISVANSHGLQKKPLIICILLLDLKRMESAIVYMLAGWHWVLSRRESRCLLPKDSWEVTLKHSLKGNCFSIIKFLKESDFSRCLINTWLNNMSKVKCSMKTCVQKLTIANGEEKNQLLQWCSTSPRKNVRGCNQRVIRVQHLPIADCIQRGAEM